MDVQINNLIDKYERTLIDQGSNDFKTSLNSKMQLAAIEPQLFTDGSPTKIRFSLEQGVELMKNKALVLDLLIKVMEIDKARLDKFDLKSLLTFERSRSMSQYRKAVRKYCSFLHQLNH